MSLFLQLTNFFIIHSYLAYLILFLGSFVETLVGIGIFIPGEIFFLSGSILAGIGYLNIWLVFVVCVVGGICGDSFCYFLGKNYGKQISSLLFKKERRYFNNETYRKWEKFFKSHGAKSVYIGRFIGPIFSSTMPFFAGIFGVKFRQFLKYNALGTTIGIGQYIVAGYLIGAAYLTIITGFKKYLYVISASIIVLFMLLYLIGKKVKFVKRFRQRFLNLLLKHFIIISIIYMIIYLALLYLISIKFF